jgi:hypothetical protein
MDYIDIAGVVDRIETDNAIIYFNQDDIRKDYPNVDDSLGVPYGIDKKTKEIYYYKATDPAMTFTLEMMYKISTDKFKELFDAQKASTSGTYSMCSILSTTIPLVVVTAYAEGLTNVLDKAHIEYVLMNYKDPKYKDYNNDRYEKIKFNDGYLFYIAGYIEKNQSFDMDFLTAFQKELTYEMVSHIRLPTKYTYYDFDVVNKKIYNKSSGIPSSRSILWY